MPMNIDPINALIGLLAAILLLYIVSYLDRNSDGED